MSTPTAKDMQRLIAGELSLRSRIAYTALLLLTLGAAGAIGSLWLTEPSLPLRTHLAFAVLVGINLSWVSYATWVLTRRRVLLAGHRIIAGRMAVTFSAVFVAGAAIVGIWGPGGSAAFAAAGFGLVMLAVAIALLIHARKNFARLLERRRVLEVQLQEASR
ncbi:MAG TPA: hypothetical protein VF618_17095 [Thermoanaerobaculia bacterium]